MLSKFFKQKIRGFGNFMKGNRGKVASEENIKLKNDQNKIYEAQAYEGIDPDSKRFQPDPQEKVLRESGGQDISAI